jgi:hypothetical protein
MSLIPLGLSGPFAVNGLVGEVHTTQKNPLGIRAFDLAGNEYVYLQGIASTIVGSWVMYRSDTFITTLTVAAIKGKIAVATAAVLASQFGWYCINGLITGSVATGAAAGKVWVTATPGRVDNTDVATDLVAGALQVGATAANLATFELNYPICLAEVYN